MWSEGALFMMRWRSVGRWIHAGRARRGIHNLFSYGKTVLEELCAGNDDVVAGFAAVKHGVLVADEFAQLQ